MNDPAITRFAAAIDRVTDKLEAEVSRAEAIDALRARQGRTVGVRRRLRIASMLAQLRPLLARWDDAMASHRDPAIVREAVRFERLRARRP